MATQLLDQHGRPVERGSLTREVAAATIGGVRSPLTGYPADGLTPVRLATILREADAGDPLRYLELAEVIEERNPHYLAVLATRKRSVTQIGITVEPASDAAADVDNAKMVEDWLRRDELADELFDILDCIGKGYSFTEITWEVSDGLWMPKRLDWRDPRWFRFDRADLSTPLMLDDGGREVPLPGFKFIFAAIKAKSGIPSRGGLARLAAWNWMFKAFTERDWAIFTQTYGQPLRVGKYGAGASPEDKDTLFRAVSNIAGDCAAIIPESMMIEFVETSSVGATSSLYVDRVKLLDEQMSKAVVGQTATTDALIGGMGSGKEHRQVQEDIERSDARALSAVLNRDLIRPWMDLNRTGLKTYPRLVIARPEPEDIEALTKAAEAGVRLGLKISAKKTMARLGLDEPEGEDDVLGPAKAPEMAPDDDPDAPEGDAPAPASKFKRVSGVFKRGEALAGPVTALSATGPLAATPRSRAPEAVLGDRMAREAAPAMEAMIARIEAMVEAAGSLQELRAMFATAFPDLPVEALGDVLGLGLVAAAAGGRLAVEDDSGAAS
jgi:phage gp29-like protein